MKQNFILLLAFICGMTIMAMELAASRLMAPYFGTSIFVWTSIIGVVMIALSLGYYYGGKLADKKPDLKVLLRLILISGTMFLIIPWIVKPIASFITIEIVMVESATAVILIGSLICAVLLFSFPIFILGMVSPFLIKLIGQDQKNLGNIAGSIFALSTVGSILGTFAISIVFIPYFGTKYSISLFAGILIITAAIGLMRKKAVKAGLMILILPSVFLLNDKVKEEPGMIAEAESAYQYIQVKEDKAGNRMLITNEGGGIQSFYRPNEVLTGILYYDFYALLPQLIAKDGVKNVLILGLAGGTIARQLDYFYRDEVNITGVEIDKEVIEMGQKYFELDNVNTKIVNQDGRIFITTNNRIKEKYDVSGSIDKYDLIIVDVYQNQMYIPWTMTTEEFFTQVFNNLSTDGMVVMNINASDEEAELLQAITNTASKVFENTYLFKIDENGWNYMLIGSKTELNKDRINSIKSLEVLNEMREYFADTFYKVNYKNSETVLTDDKAPIEFMTDKMIFNYIFK